MSNQRVQAIEFVSRKPTREWDGWGRAGFGSYGYTKFEGAFGGGLGEKVAFRASALKTDSDGWMRNRLTGNDQQGVDELAWGVSVDVELADTFSASFNVHGGETKSDSVQYRHLGVTGCGR